MISQASKENPPKTMEAVVAARNLPSGTVDEMWSTLQGAVTKKLPTLAPIPPLQVASQFYNWVLGLCCASLYVFAPQGRIHAISTILLRQFEDMKRDGHTLSSSFKTSQRYGYQPIIASPESLQAMEYYINYIRPAAVMQSGKDSPQLFISFAGIPFQEAELGRHLTTFFEKETGLHVTSNTVRKLVETTAYERYRHGLITAAELQAIHDVNGHTSATANDFYNLTDRAMDAHMVRNFLTPTTSPAAAINAEAAATITPTAATGATRSFPRRSNYQHYQFGSEHPEIWRVNPQRVAWSPDEIQYIRNWAAAKVITEDDRRTMYSRCLKDIRADIAVHPIFHPNHVKNSAKLRNGFVDFDS